MTCEKLEDILAKIRTAVKDGQGDIVESLLFEYKKQYILTFQEIRTWGDMKVYLNLYSPDEGSRWIHALKGKENK